MVQKNRFQYKEDQQKMFILVLLSKTDYIFWEEKFVFLKETMTFMILEFLDHLYWKWNAI